MQIDNYWPTNNPAEPATEELFGAWESKYGLKLPALLRTLYLRHNGSPYGIGELHGFNPVGLDGAPALETFDNDISYQDFLKTLKMRREMWPDLVNEEEIGQFLDLVGDPKLVVSFAYAYGEMCLDWNKCGPEGEPSICKISFEDMEHTWEPIAASFADFLASRIPDSPWEAR